MDTTLTGLGVRLDEGGRAENLETDFPSSGSLTCAGEPMTATIYAFKKDKAKAYRRNEGIIFTVNGQTHGHLTTDFFNRNKVGLSYLSDSILVIVDCTVISGRGCELLFMNRAAKSKRVWREAMNLESDHPPHIPRTCD